MPNSWRACHTCGRQVEVAPSQAIGDALCGWVVVSRIHNKDSFDRCSFCSMYCLEQWAQTQIPAIPDVFLHSLNDSPCNL